ncbi:YbjN domain-containing protein [Orbus sturtevantii]|uniref:YbjN domain-containing protein n=1 Tax=Orbus sturtevantii TaxID=3074109 RepID=UPI00370D5A99
MIIISELSTIAEWLRKLNVEFYQCDNCSALHLSYLQKIEGVHDAKVELIDDILIISIIAEIKASAIITLLGELSQINKSTFLTKVYLEVNDNAEPKMVFSYAMHVAEGLTFNQFSLSLASLEEEALQVISELYNCELLNNKNNLDDKPHFQVTNIFH